MQSCNNSVIDGFRNCANSSNNNAKTMAAYADDITAKRALKVLNTAGTQTVT